MNRKCMMLLLACAMITPQFNVSAAEQVTAEASSETDSVAEVEKLEAEISQQPVRVTRVDITDQNDAKFDVDVQTDIIVPIIYNESGKDVKDIRVCIIGWDENNLPVTLQSQYMNYAVGNCISADLVGVNMPNGDTLNEEEDVYQVISVDDTCNLKKARVIVVAYSTYDGDVWSNPLLDEWQEVYKEKKLIEPTVYTDKETIKKVQEALNANGYDCGTPDGVTGAKTYAALHEYQKANNLIITDNITDSLLNKMGLS